MLMAYFGALGFARPVEQLGLHTVPLPSLLYWLSKPKGANLVEASIPAGNTDMALAYRSMAIAVSREMLYKDKCPLVGVGLVYMPPYLPWIAFSAAYMHLNEWHSATSKEASKDWLVGTHLMFIQISGESEFFPVVDKHPVLLDVMSTEALGGIKASVLPLSLRGFQLHTLFTWLPDGNKVHQVTFPHLQGDVTSVFVDYEKETFPPELGHHPPMEIDLHAPAVDHWNITLDKVLLTTMEQFQCQREATASTLT